MFSFVSPLENELPELLGFSHLVQRWLLLDGRHLCLQHPLPFSERPDRVLLLLFLLCVLLLLLPIVSFCVVNHIL